MTDIKESQGLEVVAWQDAENQLYTTGEKRQMHGWATDGYPIVELVRLSDATAVIDRLREQVDYTEGTYATALEIVNELRADLETAISMLVATSKAGIQLRERVAELEGRSDER